MSIRVIVVIMVLPPELDDEEEEEPIGFEWLKEFQRISIPREEREPNQLDYPNEYEIEGMKWFVEQCPNKPKRNRAYGQIRYKDFTG